jgi:hypothetical protein
MEDEQLDHLVTLASLGEERPAQIVLGEILLRIARGRSLTKAAATALIGVVKRTIDKNRAAQLFAEDGPVRRGPRRRHNRLLEAMIVAGALQEGLNKSSVDWDAHGKSAFAEAARRLGADAETMEREAERLKKMWWRLSVRSQSLSMGTIDTDCPRDETPERK